MFLRLSNCIVRCLVFSRDNYVASEFVGQFVADLLFGSLVTSAIQQIIEFVNHSVPATPKKIELEKATNGDQLFFYPSGGYYDQSVLKFCDHLAT